MINASKNHGGKMPQNEVEATTNNFFKDDTRVNLTDFFAYLEENEMIVERTDWSWKTKVIYKDKCVCSIFYQSNEQDFDLVIEVFGDYSKEYKDIPLGEHLKETAWAHVNCCCDLEDLWCSNICSPGKSIIIFEEEFDNVCPSCIMQFNNPNAEEFECVKKLLEMKKKEIFDNEVIEKLYQNFNF